MGDAKAWIIIVLLAAQLAVSVMIMMLLGESRERSMQLRSDMNLGFIKLENEFRKPRTDR